MAKIEKSVGATPTERMLAHFCERSFLKLWSYPSPLKDDGKEFCDLLAVFEDHVFIFFDRASLLLEKGGDSETAWARWKRKTIDDQIKTAHGAARYFVSGRQLFLDKSLTVPFPIALNRERAIIHKIVVAHGAEQACRASSPDNLFGSLAVFYSDGASAPFRFCVEIDRNDPVHVFDSHTLPIVLSELDTVYDFSAYLDAKIQAIKRYKTFGYCGEEDLLAHYFLSYVEEENKYVIGKSHECDFYIVGEGEWADLDKSPAMARRREANKISYAWDRLLQHTAQNALDGVLLGDAHVLKGESALHEMAKEPRFSRRALSEGMWHAIQRFPDNDAPIVRHVQLMPSFFERKAFVFLQLKATDANDYDGVYRERRRALLELACAAAKNRWPEFETIVGIAIDAPKFSRGRNSEDFLLLRCKDWPESRRRHYEAVNASGFDFFATANLKQTHKRSADFPTDGIS